jgi:hypothetical protein
LRELATHNPAKRAILPPKADPPLRAGGLTSLAKGASGFGMTFATDPNAKTKQGALADALSKIEQPRSLPA